MCKLAQQPFLINPQPNLMKSNQNHSVNKSQILMFSESFKKSKKKLTDILENESYKLMLETDSNVKIRVIGVKGHLSTTLITQDEVQVLIFWTLKWDGQNQKNINQPVEIKKEVKRVYGADFDMNSELSEIKSNKSVTLENMRVMLTTLSFAKNDKSQVLSSKVLAKVSPLEPISRMQIVKNCLLYTSPSPRDGLLSRMPSSA